MYVASMKLKNIYATQVLHENPLQYRKNRDLIFKKRHKRSYTTIWQKSVVECTIPYSFYI